MRRWITDSEAATRELGQRLANELDGDATVLLFGDLGSGKTVLTQGLAEGLGIDAREVQSPTFTLVRDHHGDRGTLVHIDLYRLEPEDVPALGLEEILMQRSLRVIEWADRLPWSIPADLILKLSRTSRPREREIREIATEAPSP